MLQGRPGLTLSGPCAPAPAPAPLPVPCTVSLLTVWAQGWLRGCLGFSLLCKK